MKFVLANHRDRKKLTLSADHSESVGVSVTLSLSGKRVIELPDALCVRYADSIAAYQADGTLTELPE